MNNKNSRGRFRSYDLPVMSRTRFHCATLLIGPTEIRTRDLRFKVLRANHYTMGPKY